MKKTIAILIGVLFVISIVTAASINYASNSLTATVLVHSECNDGTDNDGDGLNNETDPHCHNNNNTLDIYNICHNEAGNITNCA